MDTETMFGLALLAVGFASLALMITFGILSRHEIGSHLGVLSFGIGLGLIVFGLVGLIEDMSFGLVFIIPGALLAGILGSMKSAEIMLYKGVAVFGASLINVIVIGGLMLLGSMA